MIEGAFKAAISAKTRLRSLLGSDLGSGAGQVSESITDVVGLILAVAKLGKKNQAHTADHRMQLVEQLRQRLSRHEEGVLAGEITYSLQHDEAEQVTAQLPDLLGSLSVDESVGDGDLLVLHRETASVAALLIRAAANASAGGHASDAPEERTPALDYTLDAIRTELAARAQRVERPIDPRGDVAAHHLAAGLRIRISQTTLDHLASIEPADKLDPAELDEARQAWLMLATHEYVALTTLDSQLAIPTYEERFGDLKTALVEGSANIICGARLLSRPGSFRHRRAWGHQANALTYALEAYAAGIRGDGPSIEQAQLITLTRLVRAMAAIVALELRVQPQRSTNGHSKRRRDQQRRRHA